MPKFTNSKNGTTPNLMKWFSLIKRNLNLYVKLLLNMDKLKLNIIN